MCECCVNLQPCPGPPSGCALAPGDVNSDDATNVFDVTITIDSITSSAELQEGTSCAADVNSNGIVEIGVSAAQHKEQRERERATAAVYQFRCLAMLEWSKFFLKKTTLALCTTGHRYHRRHDCCLSVFFFVHFQEIEKQKLRF